MNNHKETSNPGHRTLLSRIQNPALVLASILLTLLALETVARVYVSIRWTEQEVADLTQDYNARDGYISDPEVGYRLEPDRSRTDDQGRVFTHNSLGFRGPETSNIKPENIYRIILMGASTVYGPYVDDRETSAAQLQELLANELPGKTVEVINAGVPGWTSRETLINLKSRVLALDPDAIVVMDGRNELFPQLFNNYRNDYSHYRILGFDFIQSNAVHRKVFRLSRLAMLISTARAGDGRLGFSYRASMAAVGYIRWENKPGTEELALASKDSSRSEGFRKNLQEVIAIAQDNEIAVVLASIPLQVEKLVSGVFPGEPEILPYLNTVVKANNQITREVATMHALPFCRWSKPCTT